jgi:hypothetical protein
MRTGLAVSAGQVFADLGRALAAVRVGPGHAAKQSMVAHNR